MTERILVPLDGSPTAEAVLTHVRTLLRTSHAEVLLLQAYNVPPVQVDYLSLRESAREQANRYLRAVEERLVSEGVCARRILGEGPPAEVILHAAAREYVSLIAMSTHGRTGLSRFVLGSVAEKVLRASDAPVLVVRSFGAAPAELSFRRILVPFDGSQASLAVSCIVKELFAPLDARVVLLHVLDPQWEGVQWALPERPMKEAADAFIAACLPTTTEVRKGDPATEILNACRDYDIDIIAMTTHGRTGPSRWVFGSVTEKVLRAATVPLLVVRSRKEAS